jgi:hypothetical protein
MPAADQALRHICAHAPQTDHAKLHRVLRTEKENRLSSERRSGRDKKTKGRTMQSLRPVCELAWHCGLEWPAQQTRSHGGVVPTALAGGAHCKQTQSRQGTADQRFVVSDGGACWQAAFVESMECVSFDFHRSDFRSGWRSVPVARRVA